MKNIYHENRYRCQRDAGRPQERLEVYTTQLIQAITRLLDNSTLRAKMGKAERAYVEREWNWERSSRQLSQLVNCLL